jgi:hypothetical protein
MVSWRDTASQQAQDDADSLLSTVLEVAGQRLVADGGFYPFGAAYEEDGGLVLLAGDPDLGDQPTTDAVLESLYSGTADRRGLYRSVALAADVAVEDRNGVRVELEHRDGTALVLLVPYERSADGGLEYGEMEGSITQRRVWAAD